MLRASKLAVMLYSFLWAHLCPAPSFHLSGRLKCQIVYPRNRAAYPSLLYQASSMVGIRLLSAGTEPEFCMNEHSVHVKGGGARKAERRRGEQGQGGVGEGGRKGRREGRKCGVRLCSPGVDFPSCPALLSLEVRWGFQVRALAAEAL